MSTVHFQGFVDNMTTISRRLFDQSIQPNLHLSDAIACLKEHAAPRTLWSTILKYSKEATENALKKHLSAALISHHPDAKSDTIQRKIRDWAKTADRTIDKQTAFELCFALGLTIDQADGFLSEVTEEGLHWRDPQEMICIFGLDQGLTYPEVCALCEHIADIDFDSEHTQNLSAKDMTAFIRDEFKRIRSADELIAYIRAEHSRLGRLHQTAYHMFEQMMNVLISPDEMSEEEADQIRASRRERGIDPRAALDPVLQYDLEKKLTVREVLRVYLHRGHVPQTAKKSGKSSAIERLIAKNWPNEKELSQMKTRAIDVSRKTLMLLFLATDGAVNDYDAYDYDADDDFRNEDIDWEQEEFESSVVRLNTMLSECGMRLLDPRIPFDWMVLYCLCSSDALSRDAQIQQFLDALYPDAPCGDKM